MIITFDSDRFRKVAEEHGDATLEAIAARTGLDMGVLSRLRNGKRQPSLRTAKVAAIAYGKLVDDFISVQDAA